MDELQIEFGRENKRRKGSPLGEDCYLLPDGRIKRDEDAIIALQRRWTAEAYAPPNGVMYLKKIREIVADREKRKDDPSYTYFRVYSSECKN